jgi:hypothetical protein
MIKHGEKEECTKHSQRQSYKGSISSIDEEKHLQICERNGNEQCTQEPVDRTCGIGDEEQIDHQCIEKEVEDEDDN